MKVRVKAAALIG